jgi:teichuronic acid biosynthesis glycosyltransferase TuaG
MNHKISIITPVYNSSAFIADTIQSVLNQTYQNWELLLVDDVSTDDSVAVVQSFRDERIKLMRLEKNSGPAIARNTAIEAATGRFIAFLDSDDLWLPEKLEKQLQFMLTQNAAVTHTAYEVIDINGKRIGKIIRAPEVIGYRQLLNYNYIGCLTGMFDTEKTGKMLMPDIPKRQDYGLWLAILRQGFKAYYLDEVLAQYRTGRQSVSSNKFDTAKYNWQILRETEGLSFFKAAWHFAVYTLLGIKKYYF